MTKKSGQGTLTIYHESNSIIWWYEIDGGDKIQVLGNNQQDIVCGGWGTSSVNLSAGTHKIVISNSGCGGNASGFTQSFSINDGDCIISKVDCGSYEL